LLFGVGLEGQDFACEVWWESADKIESGRRCVESLRLSFSRADELELLPSELALVGWREGALVERRSFGRFWMSERSGELDANESRWVFRELRGLGTLPAGCGEVCWSIYLLSQDRRGR